jgi:hypothetical protein
MTSRPGRVTSPMASRDAGRYHALVAAGLRARHENSQHNGHGPPYGCNPIIEIHRWQFAGGLPYIRDDLI